VGRGVWVVARAGTAGGLRGEISFFFDGGDGWGYVGGMTREPCICIVGLGLMGASLAMALRERGYAGRLVAYARREETRRAAVARGIVDGATGDADAAAGEASLVVLCVPVRACADFAAEIAPVLQEGALVTDVGSTKGWLDRQMAGILRAGAFVGSHPIAGSEQQGLDAARGDLYEGAVVVVTGGEGASGEAVGRVSALWEGVGARVVGMSPEEHDRVLARTSHLPHVAAAALAAVVGREGAAEVAEFCGGGFADSTRVAAGGVELWMDILTTNAGAVAEELGVLRGEVERVCEALRGGRFAEVAEFLARARGAREELVGGRARAGGDGGG
jgi:prephenate dehydrogenase